jgi:type VI secretion system protein ImpL
MTIPLEQSAKAHSLFAPESGYLYYTLMHYRLERLSIAAPAATQLRILDFPLRFTAACKKLDLFATSLFRPNPFHESPLWRGCYFTNATTSGSTASNTDAANEVLASGGYFIQDFFQDVLMRDRDLAASFQLRQHHPERLRKVLVATAAGLLLLLLGGFVTSLVLNRQLTNEALERSMRVDELTRTYNRKDLAKTDETALRTELEAVDALRETLTKLDDYDRHSPPLYLRFGFYSGQTIDPYLRASYFDFTSQHFLQPAVAAMEKDLQAFTRATTTPTGTNPALSPLTGEEELGRCYDLLKTYLMLSQPERAEATFLSAMLADYWKKTVPPDMELMALQQLRFYASQAQRKDVPHYKPNEQLVAEVRRRLTTYPAVNRLYKQITSQVNAKVAPVTLDTIIPLQKRGWLTSTYAVPGSFTIEGYYGYTQQALTTAAAEMSKDDWVMGQAAAVSKDESADVSKLQTLYFREYSAQWQKFTQSIRIQPYKTKEDAVETLKALAANDSPLVLVMSEVVRQTNLTQQPRNGGIKAWFKRLFSQSQTTPPQGIAEVEKEYKAAWQFASESGEEASPFSQYRATLRTVLESLESTSADQLSQTSKQLLTGKDELGLHKAELNIGKLLESFKTDAARDIATLLKQPLGNLRAMLYGSGYAEIEQIWREQLYPKAHTLEAGFPFTDKGEASVTDLSRFFNPVNGQFSLFFNERLATSFEDAQGQWRLKESGVFRFAPDFVSYLNNARQLREAIFPQGSQQPEISYEITLQPLSGIDCAIEIDGIRVETRGSTPQSAKFVWPARAGASGAKITLIQNNQIAEKVFPGEWGLFKMVATGNANFTSGDQIPLAWNVGSATVRATLRPSSRVNPFSRNIFTQLHAPQKLRE